MVMVYKEEVVGGGGEENCRDSKNEQQFNEYDFILLFSKSVEK